MTVKVFRCRTDRGTGFPVKVEGQGWMYQCVVCKAKGSVHLLMEDALNAWNAENGPSDNTGRLITDEYRELNRRFHEESEVYGIGGHEWATHVEKLAGDLNSTSILDYGCGKSTLANALPDLPIREYDPAVPGKDALPDPADFVVCTDVLEHIEPHCLRAVLDHICETARKLIMVTISVAPAVKSLPDGRNAHLSVHPVSWWLSEFNRRVDIIQLNVVGPTLFIIALKPKEAEST